MYSVYLDVSRNFKQTSNKNENEKPLLKLIASCAMTLFTTTLFAQWQNVGTAGFSDGISAYTSLKFSPTGEPHVAFVDLANYSK